jgi:hypothetical protein
MVMVAAICEQHSFKKPMAVELICLIEQTDLCLCVKTDVNAYEVRGGPLFPYVARVAKTPLVKNKLSSQDASEKTPLLNGPTK